MSVAIRRLLIPVLVCGMFVLCPPDAGAQQWLQTSQLITPIERDGASRALLDTLVQVIERRDDVQIKRSPDDTEDLSLSELRDRLINESGLGLTSANNVFIDYRFEIENRGFEESIEALQFVYRPPGDRQEDIQMLYVDAMEEWVQKILKNKGTTLVTNEAALQTFSDQLSFARMVDDGQIVEIAGNTVREGFEEKKRQLEQKIKRLTYESM